MAITIDWATKVISVPKADMTMNSATSYTLDVDAFRQTLKSLEDDADGMSFLDTHRHNTEVTLGGVTLARTVEIINGYTITFEDDAYSVTLTGANNNIADVMNLNTVSLRANNSAGLITVNTGGPTAQDFVDDLMSEAMEVGLTYKQSIRLLLAAMAGKVSGAGGGTITFRNPVADDKDRIVATVDASGNRTAITYDVTD